MTSICIQNAKAEIQGKVKEFVSFWNEGKVAQAYESLHAVDVRRVSWQKGVVVGRENIVQRHKRNFNGSKPDELTMSVKDVYLCPTFDFTLPQIITAFLEYKFVGRTEVSHSTVVFKRNDNGGLEIIHEQTT